MTARTIFSRSILVMIASLLVDSQATGILHCYRIFADPSGVISLASQLNTPNKTVA
jgi:hypothetical protein